MIACRHLSNVRSRVCIIRPLWQIRIFGLFFHAKSRFCTGPYIGPYIPFSNCKWHRRCMPDWWKFKCSNAQTTSWIVINVFQTSDSLTVNDDSLKSSESKESLRRSDSEDNTRGRGTESLRTNIQKHCIRPWHESGVMPHGTARDNCQLLFRHPVHVGERHLILTT